MVASSKASHADLRKRFRHIASLRIKRTVLRFADLSYSAFPWSKGSPSIKTGQKFSMTALNEALSDADTQEPVKPEPQSRHIPESDDDDDDIVMIRVKGSQKTAEKKPNDKKASGKASRVVEPITDSDHSDDELQADPPVDFGEEEEDEEEQKAENPEEESPAQSKNPEQMDCDGEDKNADNSAQEDGDKGVTKKRKEKSTSQSPKKARKAKTKELSPSKTIKKSKVEPKAKPKAAKGRQAAPKKATQVGRTKQKSSGASRSSVESNAQASTGEQVPKKASKSTPLVKKAMKSSSKGEKASSTKPKSLKVKKKIDKEEVSKDKKSPMKKSTKATTPVTTYSKKAKKAVGRPSKGTGKEKKKSGEAAKAPKTLGGKAVQKTKAARKKKDDEQEESETGGNAECESEGDEPTSDSESMTDELAKTPAAKLKIMGNLACSSRDQNAGALLDHAVQQLGRYNIISYNAESNAGLIAYIIGIETKRGWGLLQAMVSGVPLVSENWLSGSISEGKWLPMGTFRSDRFGQSPRSVSSTGESGGKLLDGLRIKVVSSEKDASSIRKIVRLCGARLAETRVDLVILDSKRKVDDSCPHVQKKWLADSIEAGVPLEYDPYSLG
ncbi:hypothetical protein FGB62_59g117 [Gracilaria domingensis]|nr:hypothetical protein FGB62_59g117 [Gracilaria domingensis]